MLIRCPTACMGWARHCEDVIPLLTTVTPHHRREGPEESPGSHCI